MSFGGGSVQEGRSHLYDFALDHIEFGESKGVQRIVEQELFVDIMNQLLDVVPTGGVDQAEQPTAMYIRVSVATLFQVGEDVFALTGVLVHAPTLWSPSGSLRLASLRVVRESISKSANSAGRGAVAHNEFKGMASKNKNAAGDTSAVFC